MPQLGLMIVTWDIYCYIDLLHCFHAIRFIKKLVSPAPTRWRHVTSTWNVSSSGWRQVCAVAVAVTVDICSSSWTADNETPLFLHNIPLGSKQAADWSLLLWAIQQDRLVACISTAYTTTRELLSIRALWYSRRLPGTNWRQTWWLCQT